MRPSGLAALSVLLAAVLASPARAQLHEEWDTSYAGIRVLHRFGVDAAGVRQSYRVALVDLTHPDVSIQVANNHDSWRGAKETVRGMADRHGAALAVNGDYWAWGANDPSQGTTAVDGTCYRAHPERSAIAFDAALSRVEIGRFGTWPIPDGAPDDCPGWVHHAIGAGPQFIFDGAVRWEERANAVDSSVPDINGDTFFGAEAWAWDSGRQPNTAAGITADGRTLILVTCDGRGAGEAGGCRMASDVADLLLEHGAHQGLKLDSGGSTTFYYAGEVVNHVSDGAATAPRERAVVNALLVHSRRVDPGCGARLAGEPLTIDDGSFCFVRSGRYWWAEEAGERGLARTTYGFDGDAPDSVGRWRFGVDVPGTYRVEARVPDFGPLSARAPYTVAASGATVIVDQEAARGGWADLGEHRFDVAAVTEVRLEDTTGDAFHGVGDPRSRRLAFDAIRITPVEVAPVDAGVADVDAGAPGDDAATPGPDAAAPDAARVDGGPAVETDPPGAGCGCRAATGSTPSWPLALSLSLAALALARRRRRSRAPATAVTGGGTGVEPAGNAVERARPGGFGGTSAAVGSGAAREAAPPATNPETEP